MVKETREEKIKRTCIKFHSFEEFPMRELIKIDEAMLKLGYVGNLVSNGNIVYVKIVGEFDILRDLQDQLQDKKDKELGI